MILARPPDTTQRRPPLLTLTHENRGLCAESTQSSVEAVESQHSTCSFLPGKDFATCAPAGALESASSYTIFGTRILTRNPCPTTHQWRRELKDDCSHHFLETSHGIDNAFIMGRGHCRSRKSWHPLSILSYTNLNSNAYANQGYRGLSHSCLYSCPQKPMWPTSTNVSYIHIQ